MSRTVTARQWLIHFSLIITLSTVTGCSQDGPQPPDNNPPVPNNILVDSLATQETVALFQHLQSLTRNKVLFGHQDDLAYGIGWWAVPDSSDVKAVCGDYPAVYGWDLGDIQEPANLDGVNFEQMKYWIKKVFARGGINTISMHLDNPVSGGNAWDNSAAVKYILPGGSHHEQYLQTLDKIAAFLKDLKTDDGVYVPIILRPYHEHNHSWSWWGVKSCTAEEYNALWHMTVTYFRDEQQIHHLLYAISPQEVTTASAYLERYPGDEYVDIFGYDYYKLWDIAHVTELGNTLAMLNNLAEEHGKVAALTEVGIEKIPIANWWTHYLLASFKLTPDSRGIAWALVWRNASKNHHFAPYPGHISAANFVAFYNDSLTMFQSQLPDMYH